MTSAAHCVSGLRVLLALALSLLAPLAFAASDSPRAFDIPTGQAEATLKQFAAQAGAQFFFSAEKVNGTRTNAVKGEMTARQALDALLANTGLVAVQDTKTGALTVQRDTGPNDPRVAQEEAATRKSPGKTEDGALKLDKFEVMGTRLINADLPRTENDARPYVVFDRTQIEGSMATSLEDFFKTRLPMNQVQTSSNQSSSGNSRSTVNLRGLGANQTLILVDGRRMPASSLGSGFGQADINGIPLGMVERIEILPSTASGIYGGGATGGVINIITRKDYSGVDLILSYGNTFDTDASTRRVDLNGSFTFDRGRAHVTVNYSRSDGTKLTLGDRTELTARGRDLLLANNPSALYDAFTPPEGYTSNIRSQNGSNLVLKSGTPLNSPRTFVPVGYAGPATDGGAALVANAGRYNLDLPQTIRIGALGTIIGQPETETFAFNLRRSWGPTFEAYADFSSLENRSEAVLGTVPFSTTLPATAPNNPFTTTVNVGFPATNIGAVFKNQSDTLRATAGVIVRLPRDWTASADYVWGRSRSSSSQQAAIVGDPDGTGPALSINAALANGTLDVLRDLNAFPLNYTPYLMADPYSYTGPSDLISRDATLRASGPLWQLPAGALTLSGSVEWRQEKSKDSVNEFANANGPTKSFFLFPSIQQTAKSGYLETRLPLAAESSGWRWVHALEAEAAVRHDDYSSTTRATTDGLTGPSRAGPFPTPSFITREAKATNSTVGLRFAPVKDLAFRVSWGDGFLAPNLNQLSVGNSFTSPGFLVTDPKRGNVPGLTGPVVINQGGDPNLTPELSESISAGLIFSPQILPGFRLSVDYTRIKKSNEIGFLSFQQTLDFEDVIPGRVTRAPLTPADQALGYSGGVITTISNRFLNVASKQLTAYDIQADYTHKTDQAGEFHVYALATYARDFETAPVPGAVPVDSVGFNFGPLEWRGNGGVDWTLGPWTLGWNLQYYSSYFGYSATSSAAQIASFVLNQGTNRIPSQSYQDVQVRYRIGPQAKGWRGLLANTETTIGVQNVLNDLPPSIATTIAFNNYSTYGDPRLRRYTIVVRKHF